MMDMTCGMRGLKLITITPQSIVVDACLVVYDTFTVRPLAIMTQQVSSALCACI
jgi:hypothetical protein